MSHSLNCTRLNYNTHTSLCPFFPSSGGTTEGRGESFSANTENLTKKNFLRHEQKDSVTVNVHSYQPKR